MKEKTLDRLLLIAAIVMAVILLGGFGLAYADDDGDSDCGYGQCGGGNGTSGTDVSAAGEANSQSDASSESTSAGGKANVETSNRSTSLVLYGARDTAPCFTKVTFGAEIFGIGFSRSDPYCKKVRAVARQLTLENWDAAARLECTLKIWKEIYGKDKEACRHALFAGPDEFDDDTQSGVWVPNDKYQALLMVDIDAEEYHTQQRQIADKFAQYDNLITSQQQQAVLDDKEIERLKAEAAYLRAAEKKRGDKESARRAAARAALEDDEDDGSESVDK